MLTPRLAKLREIRARREPASVECRIVHKANGKWEAVSEDGSRSFGEFDTKEQAEKRLRQVEFFKRKKAKASRASAADPQEVAAQALAMLERRGHLEPFSIDLTQGVYDHEAATARLARWRESACDCCGGVELVKDHKQPDSAFGNVETILDRAMPEARRSVAKLADRYKQSVRGLSSPAAIFGALVRARQDLDIRPVSRALERRMVQAFALGALDSAAETALDDPSIGEERIEDVVERGGEINEAVTEAQTARLSAVLLQGDEPPDFSRMRFEQAVRFFRDKQVIQRAEFDRLSALAKQRAFTVAGVLSDQMLATIQAELVRQIGTGAALDDFAKFIDERLKDAGFLGRLADITVPGGQVKSLTSAWHVETVYRTNALNAYNAGRAAEMQANVATRPVWEIRATRDSATRPTHRRVHMVRLLASDPFWDRAYPPFGFNCRCRVVSRGPDFVSKVVSGSTIRGLPDPGFTSGRPTLLR